ncbi:unnamed protein product [Paramecium primaurelia]|uniref:Uncharacterized protein n=1 Tax=Paramecium primaurelia TaxID=5886 RepID=A0A8S1KFB9_PARPR|nr:unnamed protein product [Paramecium primaurelia]
MSSQITKKPSLKLQLNKKTLDTLAKEKANVPPSSKCSQKTVSSINTTSCTSSSSKQNYPYKESKSNASKNQEEHSQIIQYLLQENIELHKQNQDKDQLINFLSNKHSPKRRSILNTERSTEIKSSKLPQIQQAKSSLEIDNLNDGVCTPFCFTFCQQDTQSQQSIRNKKLPKEFQIVPNKKRYFV